MRLERDGYPYVFGAALTALVCFVATLVVESGPIAVSGWVFVILTLFFAFFFRCPERTPSGETGIVCSPADGTVLKVERLESYPGFSGAVDKISIFLSVFDVHVNWVPAPGIVKSVRHISGNFRLAWVDKASEDNERTEVVLETPGGVVLFKQIAGTVARRIVCRLSEGQKVQAGEKFGMIKFSSRAEVFLPAGSEILVKPREHVRGGQTTLARYLPVQTDEGKSNADETAELNQQ